MVLMLGVGLVACKKAEAPSTTRCPEPPAVVRELDRPVSTKKAKGAEEDEEKSLTKLAKPAVRPTSSPNDPAPGMVRVDVVGVVQDAAGGDAVLLLQRGGDRLVPIWIGTNEAVAIQLRLSDQSFTRPLTHDLLEKIMADRGVRVARVEIDALRESTFLARLYLADANGRVSRVDARPSDSIALAVGAGAPIYMAQGVLDATGVSAPELGIDPSTLPRPEPRLPSI